MKTHKKLTTITKSRIDGSCTWSPNSIQLLVKKSIEDASFILAKYETVKNLKVFGAFLLITILILITSIFEQHGLIEMGVLDA